mmetsp:Transcript_19266/g.44631  ORF Transcript_19266/g.44631 Transcript_19266/m.44631 type:complete len:394 (+) Transcript_19266:172-1353(+)
MSSSWPLLRGGRIRGRGSLLRNVFIRHFTVLRSAWPVRFSSDKVSLSVLSTLDGTISNKYRFYSNDSRQLSDGLSYTLGASSTPSSSLQLPFSLAGLALARQMLCFHRFRTFGSSKYFRRKSDDNQSLRFSPITETPFDCDVVERPYTMMMMEDEVSSLFSKESTIDNRKNQDKILAFDPKENNIPGSLPTTKSWIPTFRSIVPRKHGMSFGSICLDWQQHLGGIPSITNGLQSLTSSQLPTISDAILVARGPVASLCAQYYLESFSLQGLIMIDPILVDDSEEGGDGNSSDSEAITSLLYRIYQGQDCDDMDRFRSARLLVEPNSVPMMVILTVPNDHAWNRSSRLVATRHGDPDGPYGSIPIVDLTNLDVTEETMAMTVLDCINTWVEESL